MDEFLHFLHWTLRQSLDADRTLSAAEPANDGQQSRPSANDGQQSRPSANEVRHIDGYTLWITKPTTCCDVRDKTIVRRIETILLQFHGTPNASESCAAHIESYLQDKTCPLVQRSVLRYATSIRVSVFLPQTVADS